jgi:DNA modification methylase
LGFLSAKNTKHYIGTEPSTKTFDGLLKMKKDFSYLGKQIDIYCKGSEVFKPKKESLDLCFTSPPYFDTEKYAHEDTQSFMKYPTQAKWVNGFLRKTIENCYNGLKENGYMLINIANTPKYKFIEEETVNISNDLGFKQEDTVQLTLSSVMGAGYKYEPIFVFKK